MWESSRVEVQPNLHRKEILNQFGIEMAHGLHFDLIRGSPRPPGARWIADETGMTFGNPAAK